MKKDKRDGGEMGIVTFKKNDCFFSLSPLTTELRTTLLGKQCPRKRHSIDSAQCVFVLLVSVGRSYDVPTLV